MNTQTHSAWLRELAGSRAITSAVDSPIHASTACENSALPRPHRHSSLLIVS